MSVIRDMTLRVGICGCSSYYKGRFEGQKLSVPIPGNRKITFTVKEFLILKGKKRRNTIRDARCHFFLDLHKEGKKIHVSVGRNQLISNGLGRTDKLYMAGGIGKEPDFYDVDKIQQRDWKEEKPVNTRVIIAGIRSILINMEPTDFQTWLSKMTPEDWRPLSQ